MFTTDNCVLVCTNSNAACDEITQRLIEAVPNGLSLFRMYAKSYKEAGMTQSIRKVSNFREDEFKFPCLAYLYKYRIVVCTLLIAGNLVRARSIDPDFDSSHFSHVFIDEAACAQEPITMVAIAGMVFLEIY